MWTKKEASLNIKIQVILAAKLAIKTFTKEEKPRSIQTRIDETIAPHYYNSRNYKVDLGISPKTRDHDQSRIDSIAPKYNSKLGIQVREGLSKMEVLHSSVLINLFGVRSSRDRYI